MKFGLIVVVCSGGGGLLYTLFNEILFDFSRYYFSLELQWLRTEDCTLVV